MSPKKNTRKSAKTTTATGKKFKGFTDEERLAMRERIQELKGADGESAVLAKIAAMPEPDRAMGKRLAESGYAVLVVNPFYRSKRAPVVPDGASFADQKVREAVLSLAQALNATTHTIFWCVAFFFASAGASAASSAAKKAGPAKNSDGRSSASRAAAPAGVARAGSRTAVAPTESGKNSEFPMP